MSSAAPPNTLADSELTGRAKQIRQKFGRRLLWSDVLDLLRDSSIVPKQCEIVFDATPLLPGEFAHTLRSANAFSIFIHPVYSNQEGALPYLVLQQLAFLLGGSSVTAEEAEQFGASCLGLNREDYYAILCELAEQTGGDELC